MPGEALTALVLAIFVLLLCAHQRRAVSSHSKCVIWAFSEGRGPMFPWSLCWIYRVPLRTMLCHSIWYLRVFGTVSRCGLFSSCHHRLRVTVCSISLPNAYFPGVRGLGISPGGGLEDTLGRTGASKAVAAFTRRRHLPCYQLRYRVFSRHKQMSSPSG